MLVCNEKIAFILAVDGRSEMVVCNEKVAFILAVDGVK